MCFYCSSGKENGATYCTRIWRLLCFDFYKLWFMYLTLMNETIWYLHFITKMVLCCLLKKIGLKFWMLQCGVHHITAVTCHHHAMCRWVQLPTLQYVILPKTISMSPFTHNWCQSKQKLGVHFIEERGKELKQWTIKCLKKSIWFLSLLNLI